MGLLVVAGAVLLTGAASSIWLLWRIDQESVTPVTLSNPGGRTGKALVVYQPGLSSFPEQVTGAYARGLASGGWQVSVTTASSQATLPELQYDLVVLGGPVYFGAPAKPLARYVTRTHDFHGKPVVILLTAAQDFETAATATERIVRGANGRPIRNLAFTTTKANDAANKYTGSNVERALQMAHDAGQKLSVRER